VCKACHVREVGVLFLPCSHAACCTECAENARTCIECHMNVAYKVAVKL